MGTFLLCILLVALVFESIAFQFPSIKRNIHYLEGKYSHQALSVTPTCPPMIKLPFLVFHSCIAMKKKAADIVPVASTSEAGASKKMEAKVDPKGDDVRGEALAGVLYQIERSYGKGSIQRLGDQQSMIVETMSSGSMTLDLALGGGYPKGRVIEIYGPESSGKTTLALHAVAEIQKAGGIYNHIKEIWSVLCVNVNCIICYAID